VVKSHRPTLPFGPHWRRRDGKRYLGYSPSKKSMGRIKDKIGDLLVPGNLGSWDACATG
jgi:RNA-directed DNA polymerase